ncbi:DALR anticodon-binding domain-containing protein, partial [Enterococcus faecalis]|uniref:DALR anticodon-binding domain-containing protein n=1 Tax=Enterococcus faecalis TaxID=1351 RepID=UPI002A82278F
LNEGQAEVVEFVKARLRQLLMTKNVCHDIIDAVVSAEQADLSKLFASANILKSRFEDQDFKPSMEALTRVINLAKKGQELLGDTEEGIDPSLFENKAEKELYQAVNDLSEAFATRTIAENYEALVNLRPLIDAYFNETMVMVEDEKVKQNRLKQLMQIAKMALSIASLDLLIVK